MGVDKNIVDRPTASHNLPVFESIEAFILVQAILVFALDALIVYNPIPNTETDGVWRLC